MKVTKKTNIFNLVKNYPETEEILLDYGLHCVSCFASQFDTIEDGCKVHGFDNSTMRELIEDINKVIGNSDKTNK